MEEVFQIGFNHREAAHNLLNLLNKNAKVDVVIINELCRGKDNAV